MEKKKKGFRWWLFWSPLPLSALVYLLFADGRIDEGIVALFYFEPDGGSPVWILSDNIFVAFAYKGVPVFTAVWGVGSTLVLILSFRVRALRPFRSLSLYCIVVLSLGPGLVVNAVFKDYWGRPRPVDTVTFGGPEPFQAPFVIGDSGLKSFPNGHASVAFSLVAFAFWLGAGRKKSFWLLMLVAMGAGSFVGWARIAVGGHYLSDTIVSAYLIVWLAWLLHDRVSAFRQPHSSEASQRKIRLGIIQEKLALAGVGVFGIVFALAALMAFPLSSTSSMAVDLAELKKHEESFPVEVRLIAGSGVRLREPKVFTVSGPVRLRLDAEINGFGFPGAQYKLEWHAIPSKEPGIRKFQVGISRSRLITELHATVTPSPVE